MFEAPIVVASEAHAAEIERQLRETGALATLILEPLGRNTAPAIALAALLAKPDQLLLVMPSDHIIKDVGPLLSAVERAASAAKDGWLVTFGVKPERPDTGFGYISRGDEFLPGVHRAEAFLEKPSLDLALTFLQGGNHFWNVGIFLFRADAYLAALEEHAPDVLKVVRISVGAGTYEATRFLPQSASFAEAPSISIDYAVMEKANRVAVVPVEMDWSDVGSWEALHELSQKDSDGNHVVGDVIHFDTRNCLIHSMGRKVAVIGADDLVVVVTDEAVLVVPRSQSQRVKEIADALKDARARTSA